jgi:hypothetical protein
MNARRWSWAVGRIGVGVVLPILVHSAVAVFSAISFQVHRIYGWPLDNHHIRAAGDMSIFGASVVSYAGVGPLAVMAGGIASYWLLGTPLAWALARLRWRRLTLWVGLLGLAVALGGLSAWKLRGLYNFGLKKNAIVHFIQYYTPAPRPVDLPRLAAELAMQIRGPEQELLRPLSLHLNPPQLSRDFSIARRAEGFNIIVIQLESTSTVWVDPETTPNLCRLASRGVSFRNHFTNFSETYKAAYAIYNSDYMTTMGAHPRQLYGRPIPQPALAEELAARGYRTAVVHAGYLRYMDLLYFFEGKGVQTMIDAATLAKTPADTAWMWGVSEEQSVEALCDWINLAKGKPFFAIYATMFPHHPYYCPLKKRPFPDDTWIGRYRNALYYADQAVGQLLDHLEEMGLAQRTLVVAVGDHGETVSTFPVGHGLHASDEELRVPMIIGNPVLFPSAATSGICTNHLDIAPTLLSLVGGSVPSQWLGRNLSAEQIPAQLQFCMLDQGHIGVIVDNGVLYVRDAKSGWIDLHIAERGLAPLPPDDPRQALSGRYKSLEALFIDWVPWRHITRAVERR